MDALLMLLQNTNWESVLKICTKFFFYSQNFVILCVWVAWKRRVELEVVQSIAC